MEVTVNGVNATILRLAGLLVWPARQPILAAILVWFCFVLTLISPFFPDTPVSRVLERGVLGLPPASKTFSAPAEASPLLRLEQQKGEVHD